MFIHCELLILILVLINGGQGLRKESKPHSRPYMVLLKIQRQDGRGLHCGGFLLNEDFVLTAALCRGQSYTVFLGLHDFSKRTEAHRASVEQTFTHEDYNETNYNNNVMLLKLSSKANFSNNVRPIPLAGRGDGSLPKSCSLSGWGRADRYSSYMSRTLMEVDVSLTDSEHCPEDFYCSEGDAGPSKGDGGGPLVCDGIAYGLVSHIIAPISGQLINCYTKIPSYRRWIDSTMKNALKSTIFYCSAN